MNTIEMTDGTRIYVADWEWIGSADLAEIGMATPDTDGDIVDALICTSAQGDSIARAVEALYEFEDADEDLRREAWDCFCSGRTPDEIRALAAE